MKIVKLSFNFDWPLFRQTKSFSQTWGNYQFIIDDTLEECDFWIVYCDYNLKQETVKCAQKNIIFIPGECYNTSPDFTKKFLNQFGLILTVQRELEHKNIIYTHNANPWFVGKTYDELLEETTLEKTKLISVITSDKVFTEGHKKRLNFVKKLKVHFGDKLDLYGRGLNDFDDKWDVLADYKYTIVIENDFCDDWVTEKFFDCMLSQTLPFYYGCPNLEDYVDANGFKRIDIDDFAGAVKIIERAIENKAYLKAKNVLEKEKLKTLNQIQFFPWITSFLEKMDSNIEKKQITLRLNVDDSLQYKFKKKIKYLRKRMRNLIIKY